MLDRNELLEYTGEYTKYQVEKDYLQHIVLAQLYANTTSELVFKGGTALQKAYALNRFSEDLDFTFGMAKNSAEESPTNELRRRIERGLQAVNNFYSASYTTELKRIAIVYKLKINGPLYVKPQSAQTISIEISIRETELTRPDTILITPRYRDLAPYFATVMSIDEMFSEKIRAVLTRRKARDLYDIYFLLHKGAKMNVDYVNRKLEFYGTKFTKKGLASSVRDLKPIWTRELSDLMRITPDFAAVERYVFGALGLS